MCEDGHKTKYQVKDLIKRISMKVSLFSNQKLKKEKREKRKSTIFWPCPQNKNRFL